VTLVSFGDIPLPEHTQWMDDLEGLDYRPTAFRLDWMQEGEQDHGEATNYLTALARELKPSVLHLNHLSHGSLPVKTPRVAVAHGDMISWWNAVHGCDPKDSPWLRWYRDAITRGLRQASAVVAPSYAMLDALQECYSWGRAGAVIYNGRNPVQFNPHVKKENSVLAVGAMLDAGKQIVLLTQRTHALPVCIVGADPTALAPRMPIRADPFLRPQHAMSLQGRRRSKRPYRGALWWPTIPHCIAKCGTTRLCTSERTIPGAWRRRFGA
jgi:hypothetical protein